MTIFQHSSTITFRGMELRLFGNGSMYLPRHEILVVSDLHLEKGAAQSFAMPLPVYDTDETLTRLEMACNDLSVKTCLFLGDSFHNMHTAFRLPKRTQLRLSALAERCSFVWVEGNHDPSIPAFLPGKSCAAFAIDEVVFSHEMTTHNTSELDNSQRFSGHVFGHYHPKAKVRLPAKIVTGRCFIHDEHALIMPAFGAFTGGLNIFDPAIQSLLSKPQTVHFCHNGQIYTYPVSTKHFIAGS